MEQVKGGAAGSLLEQGIPAEAANEALIEGSGRPAGWDPLEVWRTRIRDVADQRALPRPPPDKD
jgi:hypothetical protein